MCVKNVTKEAKTLNSFIVVIRDFILKQCDQMAILFFNIWPFTSMKTGPLAYKCAKVGPNFSQIGNKPSEICTRL